MAKLKSPFLSLGARGTIGNAITIQERHGTSFVRKKPIPAYRRTLPQVYQRWLYEDYAYLWRQQSAATRQEYASAGSRFHLTGFQYWMKVMLSTMPDIDVWLHLDEQAGNKVFDASRNLNHGTIFGASLIDGIIDHARTFDGLNDQIIVSHHSTLDLGTDDFTIEWRMKTPGAAYKEPLDKADSNYSFFTEGWCVTLRPGEPTGRLYFSHTSSANRHIFYNLSTPLTDDLWHTWALRGTRSPTHLALFVDGLLHSSQALKSPTQNIVSSQPMRLGVSGAAVGAWYLGGLDELIKYNRALDDTELLRHALRRYP